MSSPDTKKTSPSEAARADSPGRILCEYWRGVGGSSINDLRNCPDFPGTPAETGYLTIFEIPSDQGDDYGTAIRGYVHPPQTGEYTFWIASDDNSELWLSSSEKPEEKVKIAGVSEWTSPRAWDLRPEQKSKPIKLEAGRKYYIEALQKEGGGGDNLSVGWQLPDKTMERPVPGAHLSPATPAKAVPQIPPVVKLLGELPKVPGMHKLKAEIAFGANVIAMSYCLYLPKGYGPDAAPQPLFVFLHGNTHQGSDWNGILNEGPPQYLNNNPKLREAFPLIGLFPQAPAGTRWEHRPILRATIALLDEVVKQFRVEKDRVYCTGLSMGGMGTWYVAEEAPDRFAAIATISAPLVRPALAAERLGAVPVWIICGGDDGGFTQGSKQMAEVLKKAGGEVELTVVEHNGHGVWASYYPEMKFYEWLLKHRRKAGEGAR